MNKLKIPKNPFKGLKIYCKVCKRDNPNCNHYNEQEYRVRVHIPNTKNGIKSKTFTTKNYDEAVREAIEFKKDLVLSNYGDVKPTTNGNDYSLTDAIIKYNQYLAGEHELKHKKKIVSKGHQDECIRFCKSFAQLMKKNVEITRFRVANVNEYHVSDFYSWATEKYAPRTFNKCMLALKAFFQFLINDEKVKMENPFSFYENKKRPTNENLTVSKEEFEAILSAVDIADPIKKLGGKGERKNMFRPYLKEGFWIMLLTGGRREEVVELKWSDIYFNMNGYKMFMVHNRKVERFSKSDGVFKYIPIGADLEEMLNNLGYSEKKNTDEYIFYPERTEKTKTLMNDLSKAFTHYKIAAGIEKKISLKNLRKSYISWVNLAIGKDTGLITSHSNHQVLKEHYIDPTTVSAIEKVALGKRIFGT
ncbi:MAG: hypothetical protein POELPBGB_00915 [Bacteroidia bacterium]|nr:hypothetical protein [Bacteroidia bacterium]